MIQHRLRKERHILYCFIALVLAVWAACVPVEEGEKQYELRQDFSDSLVARILYFQNKQLTDSILPYFSSPDPTYRYYAAFAFQSYTDSTVSDSLIQLLGDENIKVGRAAAFALGQFHIKSNVTALIEHFDNNDSLGLKNKLNSTILEAVGKTGGKKELNLFTSIKTFRSTDTALYTGLMRGILQFQLRDIYSSDADKLVKRVLLNANFPPHVRMLACEIAHRSHTIKLDDKLYTFERLIRTTDDKELKLAYIRLLGKFQGKEVRDYLLTILSSFSDPAIQATALKVLAAHPYSAIRKTLDSMILQDNPQLRVIALDILLKKGRMDDVQHFQDLVDKTDSPFAKAKLYRIIINKLPFYYAVTKRTLRNRIMREMENTENAYAIAAYYTALAEDVSNYELLIDQGLESDEAVVRTASAKGLIEILLSPHLRRQYRSRADDVKDDIYTAFNKALRERADDGLIYELIHVADQIDFERLKASMKVAKKKLKLPNSWEAYADICRQLGQEIPSRDKYIKEISVEEIRNLEDSIQILISTEFGDMKVELYPQLAPFTVISTLELIEKGYYKDKFIHRVVPQFVIQDGCPRGDGYGSLDFMLRTETPQVYYDSGGWVGMASAGRDTESSQWFITFKATPHLNGRYTIFGKVISGLENIQGAYVGAQVNSMKIIN